MSRCRKLVNIRTLIPILQPVNSPALAARQSNTHRQVMGNGSYSVYCGPETLNHRYDALLYIAYVMLIWAAPIPADRWHCSLWP